MDNVILGDTQLQECPRCQGLWADVATVERICADREQQAVVLGEATVMPPAASREIEKVRYVPCPVCKKLMNRINFARCSAVIVDVCKGHGTWFDRDELRGIVAFIRSGGLEAARARELAELDEKRRHLAAERVASAWGTPSTAPDPYPGLRAVAHLLRAFLD